MTTLREELLSRLVRMRMRLVVGLMLLVLVLVVVWRTLFHGGSSPGIEVVRE